MQGFTTRTYTLDFTLCSHSAAATIRQSFQELPGIQASDSHEYPFHWKGIKGVLSIPRQVLGEIDPDGRIVTSFFYSISDSYLRQAPTA